MVVIFVRDDGIPESLEKTKFNQECNMRDMLLQHPDMIPVHEIKEGIRLLTMIKELRIPGTKTNTYADAVAFDKNGDIYLIETKLEKNFGGKRQVLAQVLDYGASLWEWNQSSEQFLDMLDEYSMKLFGKSFFIKSNEFFALDEKELESYKDGISNNWQKGVFRFVVYMDEVDEDLINLVKYVNRNSFFDIYLVGVDYYKTNGIQIIIPKLYGVPDRKEAESRSSKGNKKCSALSEEEFLILSEKELKENFGIFKRLYEYLLRVSKDDSSFTTSSGGTYKPNFSQLAKVGPFSLKCNGTLQIYFKYLDDNNLKNKSDFIRQQLISSGVIEKDDVRVEPSLEFSCWSPKLEDIISIIDKLVTD